MNTRFLEHFGAWGDHVGFVVFTVQPGGIPTVSRWNPRSAFIRKCIASNTSNLENGRASVEPCEKVTKDKCVYFCDVSEIFLTEAGAKKFLAESIQLDLSASKLLIEAELAHQTKLNEMLSKLGADSKAQQVEVPYSCQYPMCHSAEYQQVLTAQLTADLFTGVVVPPGYALVPIEPTPEMISAFHAAVNVWMKEMGEDADIYKAMLTAAQGAKS